MTQNDITPDQLDADLAELADTKYGPLTPRGKQLQRYILALRAAHARIAELEQSRSQLQQAVIDALEHRDEFAHRLAEVERRRDEALARRRIAQDGHNAYERENADLRRQLDEARALLQRLEAEHAAAMKWIPTWRKYGADLAGPERIAWCDAVAAAAQERKP